MTTDRKYPLELTWEDIDNAMMGLRRLIRDGEAAIASDVAKSRPDFAAEEEQSVAELWELVHKFGDARRVAHGQAPLLGSCDMDDLLAELES